MSAFWKEVFGNARPVEVEIGSGTGTFLLPVARSQPQTNFLGIERSQTRALYLDALLRERRAAEGDELRNVMVLNADASCVITHLMPAASISAYHVYFPDPWWKRRHHRRRLFTMELVAALARTLIPGGRLYTATDVPVVIDLIFRTVANEPRLQHDPELRSPRTQQTRFEQKGLQRGATIHDAVFVRSTSSY